jgi:hypothetical protein
MSDTEILNWIIREVNRGRVIYYDWQREELLCEIKVRRLRDKEERDAQIHEQSEATRTDGYIETNRPGILVYGKVPEEKVAEIKRTGRLDVDSLGVYK